MEYSIIYSERRTLCLQIKDDLSIVVRAPKRVSKEKIDEFVTRHKDWIEKKLSLISERKKAPYAELSRKEIKVLKKQLLESITPIIELYAPKMGVSPLGVSINSAKKRFGSCSSEGKLHFSYMLSFSPPEAVEYVVVHELAHLKELNHSPKFWGIVEKYLPDYKERQRLLK